MPSTVLRIEAGKRIRRCWRFKQTLYYVPFESKRDYGAHIWSGKHGWDSHRNSLCWNLGKFSKIGVMGELFL